MSRAKRPRTRSIRLVRPPGDDGIAILCLTTGDEATFYTLCEIPCEIGGRGFALHRTGLGTLYHVRIGTPEECDCDCMGFLRHGHCKHVLGLLALLHAGRLALPEAKSEAEPTEEALPLQAAADAARATEGNGPAGEG